MVILFGAIRTAPPLWKIFKFSTVKAKRLGSFLIAIQDPLELKLLIPLLGSQLHLRRHFHRCITIFKFLNSFTDFSCHVLTKSLIYNSNMRHKMTSICHVSEQTGRRNVYFVMVSVIRTFYLRRQVTPPQ